MSQMGDPGLVEDFLQELSEYNAVLKAGLKQMEAGLYRAEGVTELHRLVHIIRGDAALVGIDSLSQIASQMEGLLEAIMAAGQVPDEACLNTMGVIIGFFEQYADRYLTQRVDESALLSKANTLFAEAAQPAWSLDEIRMPPFSEEIPSLEALSSNEPSFDALSGRPSQQEAVDEELLQDFREEANEHLEVIHHALGILEGIIPTGGDPGSPEIKSSLEQIRRSVHTIKGAAAICGLTHIADWAHKIEDPLDSLYEEACAISLETVTTLVRAIDLLETMVSKPGKTAGAESHTILALLQAIPASATEKTDPDKILDALSENIRDDDGDPTPRESRTDSIANEKNAQPGTTDTVTQQPAAQTLRIGLDKIDSIVNLTGEITIATSAFDQRIAEFDHTAQELQKAHERLKDIARQLETGYEVKALEHLRSPGGAPLQTPEGDPDAFEEFDDMELDRYSELSLIIRSLNEAAIDIGSIYTQFANLSSEFDGNLTRQRVLLSEMQNKVMRARMTEMAVLSHRLRRTIRDTATKLGKQVRCVIEGEEIELDRTVWEKLSDPLMHLLRNAVDHGVESPQERRGRNKPATATIRICAKRQGKQVVIDIVDDGRGFDYAAIRQKAISTGLVSQEAKLSEDDLANLIFRQGFSTRTQVGEFSGRGVGLDVVKSNIIALQGSIRAVSEAGQSTRFTLRIPLSLAVVRAILFSVCGRPYALPLNGIKEIFRVDAKQVIRQPKPAIRLADEVVPLFAAEDLLQLTDTTPTDGAQVAQPLIVMAETGRQKVALKVDSLLSQREIVVKNLGSHLRHLPGISGITIMGDGKLVPILELDQLLETQLMPPATGSASTRYETDRPQPPTILVVDDSVMVRKVVSHQLESQGWLAQTARDGQEALDQLSEIRPDLIILDIEMPRMNGFEFLRAIRAHKAYRELPVIMLTSRSTAKHRQKALTLGADQFMVKPYREQEFLTTISGILTARSKVQSNPGTSTPPMVREVS